MEGGRRGRYRLTDYSFYRRWSRVGGDGRGPGQAEGARVSGDRLCRGAPFVYDQGMESPTIITVEQRQAIERAGDEPVPVIDAQTRQCYILVKREVYERLLNLMQAERVDRSLYEFGEFHPIDS